MAVAVVGVGVGVELSRLPVFGQLFCIYTSRSITDKVSLLSFFTLLFSSSSITLVLSQPTHLSAERKKMYLYLPTCITIPLPTLLSAAQRSAVQCSVTHFTPAHIGHSTGLTRRKVEHRIEGDGDQDSRR